MRVLAARFEGLEHAQVHISLAPGGMFPIRIMLQHVSHGPLPSQAFHTGVTMMAWYCLRDLSFGIVNNA